MQFRRTFALSTLALSLLVGGAVNARAEVQLTMQNGRVTLVAKNATLSQILAEWAKVGQTRIVNGERVPGGPMTLTLTDVPEAQALDILLRTLSGYMAAPRAAAAANLSQFDRVVIMPTLATPPTQLAGAPPPPTFQQPGSPPPPFAQPNQVADDQDDAPPRSGPVFNTFPPPQVATPIAPGVPMATPGTVGTPQGPLMLPPQQPAPMPQPAPANPPAAAYPGGSTGAPAGVSVPGMIMPTPSPGQPTPTRRPGGGQ
jgi:hypothetical protein